MLLATSLWLWPSGSVVSQDVRAPSRDIGSTSEGTRFSDTRDFVHVLDVRPATADKDELVITLRIDAGFHINANPASSEYLLETRLEFVGIKPVTIVYPIAVRFKSKFADETLDVYEGTIAIHAFFAHGVLEKNAAPQGTVAAQACTADVCLPPAVLPLRKE